MKRKHVVSVLILILLSLLIFSVVQISPKKETFREQPSEKVKSSKSTVVLDKNGNEIHPLSPDEVKSKDNLGGN